MTFLYPLGLLGLIGVPILIIIYVIKNKYMEQTIASTYVWTVSERFLKRKRPISKIAGIISLILQILAVIFISISVAHPVVLYPGQARDYFVIVDASGSMLLKTEDSSRIEEAKSYAQEIVLNAVDGSSFTIAIATDTVTVLDKTNDKDKAIKNIQEISGSAVSLNQKETLDKAQEIFNQNPSVSVYLLTDEQYATSSNVNIVNFGGEETNHSVSDLSFVEKENGYELRGNLFTNDIAETTLTIDVFVDGSTTATKTTEITVTEGNAPFSFDFTGEPFSEIRTVIREKDAFDGDNEFVLYNIQKSNEYEAIVVSEKPFFIEAFIKIVNGKVTSIKPDDYENNADYQKGYELYVFDGYSPKSMPSDGAVWFFNVSADVPSSGFSVQSTEEFITHDYLTLTDSTETIVETLTQNLSGSEQIAISKFYKYGRSRQFTTLYTCKGIPVIFTGINAYGYRQVVFAFDLHDTNFPVLYDFPVLMNNLWSYSFPEVVEKVVYEAGEEITVNAIPNVSSIKVTTPSGKSSYLEMKNGASIFSCEEVGVYTIAMTGEKVSKTYQIYSALPKTERESGEDNEFNLEGESEPSVLNGVEDVLYVAFIVLAVLTLADWMVYCYDKYQLR